MTTANWTARDALIVVPPRRRDVICEPLDGEVIFSHPATDGTYHLNETAYFVWSCCDGHTTTRAIVDGLVTQYDVAPDAALDHVEQLVAFFAEAGLLQTEAAS